MVKYSNIFPNLSKSVCSCFEYKQIFLSVFRVDEIICDINSGNFGSLIGTKFISAPIGALSSGTDFIQGAFPVGNYNKIVLVVDMTNSLSESNRTNNIACFPIQIAQPNFTLSPTVLINPTSFFAGDNISVNYTVINAGDLDVSFYSTDIKLKNANGSTINTFFDVSTSSITINANGGTLNRDFSFLIPSNLNGGNYKLEFEVDAGNNVNESNETDNVVIKNITIMDQMPDLMFSTPVTISPSAVVVGNTATITGAIKNQGVSIANNVVIKYYLSSDINLGTGDTYLSSSSIASLAPNAISNINKTITIPSNYAAGTEYLIAVIDEGNSIPELVENNNTSERFFTINQSQPDLDVISVTMSSSSVLKGNTVDVSANVKNIGTGDAGNVQVYFFLSTNTVFDGASTDFQLDFGTAFNMSSGISRTVTKTVTIPTWAQIGTNYIIAYVDYTGSIGESNETNNTGYKSFSATSPAPNLLVQSFSLSTANFFKSSATASPTATVSVKNSGNVSVGSSSSIKVYLSTNSTLGTTDIEVGSATLVNLGAGGSASRTITLSAINPNNPANGSYYLIVKVDAANAITESNENDNTSSKTFTVSP